jgi:hypothetical protein
MCTVTPDRDNFHQYKASRNFAFLETTEFRLVISLSKLLQYHMPRRNPEHKIA